MEKYAGNSENPGDHRLVLATCRDGPARRHLKCLPQFDEEFITRMFYGKFADILKLISESKYIEKGLFS
jgi:hypothetical protein